MQCPKCGANVPNGATACGNCGTKFQQGKRCPNCQNVIPANATVCPMCGARFAAQAAGVPSQKATKLKQKGGFQWWYILVAVFMFALGVGVGALLFGNVRTSAPRDSASSEVSSLPSVASEAVSSSATEESSASEEPSISPEPVETPSTYKIGETWIVDGQWEFTITDVIETEERNEFSDKTPAAVYNIKFTYKNIGYVDSMGLMDGLFFNITDTIIDSQGEMGYSYPGTVTDYAKETPVDASCTAEDFIGVNHPGSFKLVVAQYDGNREKRTATFELDITE